VPKQSLGQNGRSQVQLGNEEKIGRYEVIDQGMDFELSLRLFLGNRAYHSASFESYIKSKLEWLQKVAKKIIKRIDELDTTTRHKQMLAAEAERFFEKVCSSKVSPWEVVYVLIRLCGRLLGFDFPRGSIVHTPIYYQSSVQYYTSQIFQGGDTMQDYYDQKDMVAVRKRIIKQLKKEGFSDFKIGLVLNTSEYHIKKTLIALAPRM
jgi:hypothetical protein